MKPLAEDLRLPERREPDRPVILVATDGSAGSLLAGEQAVRLAKSLGARLYVLNVVDTNQAFHAGIHYGEALLELKQAGVRATEEIKTLSSQKGVPCETAVLKGDPARAIIEVADYIRADYIVVGSGRKSGVGRILLGSVSSGVLRRAGRPVLVVAEQTPRNEEARG
jgi:nucleotide-binding universal stress UspA family protein